MPPFGKTTKRNFDNNYSTDIHLDILPVWKFEDNYGPRLRRSPFFKNTKLYCIHNNRSNASSGVITKMSLDATKSYIRSVVEDYLLNK